MQPFPVGLEFFAMEFGPGLHQPALRPREVPGDQFDRIDAEYAIGGGRVRIPLSPPTVRL